MWHYVKLRLACAVCTYYSEVLIVRHEVGDSLAERVRLIHKFQRAGQLGGRPILNNNLVLTVGQ